MIRSPVAPIATSCSASCLSERAAISEPPPTTQSAHRSNLPAPHKREATPTCRRKRERMHTHEPRRARVRQLNLSPGHHGGRPLGPGKAERRPPPESSVQSLNPEWPQRANPPAQDPPNQPRDVQSHRRCSMRLLRSCSHLLKFPGGSCPQSPASVKKIYFAPIPYLREPARRKIQLTD